MRVVEREAGLAPKVAKAYIYIRFAEIDRRRSDEIFRGPETWSVDRLGRESVVRSTKERVTQPSLVTPTRLIPSKNECTSELTLE